MQAINNHICLDCGYGVRRNISECPNCYSENIKEKLNQCDSFEQDKHNCVWADLCINDEEQNCTHRINHLKRLNQNIKDKDAKENN